MKTRNHIFFKVILILVLLLILRPLQPGVWFGRDGWQSISSAQASSTQKIKSLLQFVYRPTYGQLTDEELSKVKNSPYDGYIVHFFGAYSDESVSLADLSSNINAIKKSGKEIWPRVYFNRIVGCCLPPACVAKLKKENRCSDTAALQACYKEVSPGFGFRCNASGYYCSNSCESAKSLPASFKKIYDLAHGIDLENKAGALAKFYDQWKTALGAAKASGSPGIFIDNEFYSNYSFYRLEQIADEYGVTESNALNKLKNIGYQLADLTNQNYPQAVLIFASADLSIRDKGIYPNNRDQSMNYIVQGILEQAKLKKYKLKVVEGAESSLWYLHPALDNAKALDVNKNPVALKQMAEKRDADMTKFLNFYPNFYLGGTHGLYLDYLLISDKAGTEWYDSITEWSKKGWLKVKKISDFEPLLDYLFKKYEYVWIYNSSLSGPYGSNDFDYGKYTYNNKEYISQFREVMSNTFCGNNSCEAKRTENCVSCPSDCGACLSGDLNQDSIVNIIDLGIIMGDFLKKAAEATYPHSDVDGDGTVTIKDLGILMSEWK